MSPTPLPGGASGLLIYDGGCGVCQRLAMPAARMAEARDVRVAAHQELGDARLERLGLTRADCARRLRFADRRGRVHGGALAVNRFLLAAAPGGLSGFLLRLAVILMYAFPPLLVLEALGYELFARNRHRFGRTDCGMVAGEEEQKESGRDARAVAPDVESSVRKIMKKTNESRASTRRRFVARWAVPPLGAAGLLAAACGAPAPEMEMAPETRSVPVSEQPAGEYVRFAGPDGSASYGRMEGDGIVELHAAPWAGGAPTGRTVPAGDVRLLAPVEPVKVIAVGLNYMSHLGGREPSAYPGLFAKLPTSIVGPGDAIRKRADAGNLHYEGEMVIVIGREASDVTEEAAADHVFGVTAGNDVSERDWQSEDLQWFRAKGSDTFGPIGPVISRGVNYDDLMLRTRLNGEVVQEQRTADLIFDTSRIVSYVSRYVTLSPGDVIFTGTPGTTRAMEDGDMVSVEVETVGVLENQVRAR